MSQFEGKLLLVLKYLFTFMTNKSTSNNFLAKTKISEQSLGTNPLEVVKHLPQLKSRI